MRRLRAAVLPVLLLAATPAAALDLCARLGMPPELGLTCTTVADEAVIAPATGAFAVLSRMTLRPLERDSADAAAWSDPGGWLRSQMRIDLSALEDAVGAMAQDPDSPFAGGQATAALEGLKGALAWLTTLTLAACEQPRPDGADAWHLRCNYTADGLGLLVALRLVAKDDARWAIVMRAANEQRLRHFEAIANSFQPP